MFKINLEQKLIRQNTKLGTPAELLQIANYERMAPLTKNDTLTRVGINKAVIDGQAVKQKIDAKRAQTASFDQSRVFHISQIKQTCNKYYLRFLDPKIYKGTLDADLAVKIETFELAHGIKCTSYNTKIMAPPSMFKLAEVKINKDPLFFYQINDEYFYLIHKWGNDLSVFRRLLTVLSSKYLYYTFFIMSVIIFGVLSGTWLYNNSPMVKGNIAKDPSIVMGVIAGGALSLVYGVIGVVLSIRIFPHDAFIPPNDWDSEQIKKYI